MLVRNKWNGKTYTVVEVTTADFQGHDYQKVTLQRQDGTTFTIAKKEFNFSYISLDKVN